MGSVGGISAVDADVSGNPVTGTRAGGMEVRVEPQSGEGEAGAGAPPTKRRRVDGGAGAAAAAAVAAAAPVVVLRAPLVAGGLGGTASAGRGLAAEDGQHSYAHEFEQQDQPLADQPVADLAAVGRQHAGRAVEVGEEAGPSLPSLHCAVVRWQWLRWRTGGGAGGQGGQAHVLYRHGDGQIGSGGQLGQLPVGVNAHREAVGVGDGARGGDSASTTTGEEEGAPAAGPGTGGEGPGGDGGRLEGVWRCQLGRCVDAPAVFAELAYDSDAGVEAAPGTHVHGRQQQQQQQGPSSVASPGRPSNSVVQPVLPLVLACSHDGDVTCLDAHSGRPHWHVRLPARAEAGMALAAGPARLDDRDATGQCTASASPYRLPYVVVACDDGQLYSLDMRDGHVRGVVPCGGAFKCAPASDPWVGAVWATSHGRCVTVVRPPDQVLARWVARTWADIGVEHWSGTLTSVVANATRRARRGASGTGSATEQCARTAVGCSGTFTYGTHTPDRFPTPHLPAPPAQVPHGGAHVHARRVLHAAAQPRR